jgi:hypothetical protein
MNDTDHLGDDYWMLENVFSTQAEFQRVYFGHDFETMSRNERIDYVRWNILALLDEMHEALAEVGWKPWALAKYFNKHSFQGELVDAFHFFVNLCLASGMDAQALMKRYHRKQRVNRERQDNGYDGVKSKCPLCKRAYDDADVKCAKTQIEWGKDDYRDVYYCDKERT